MKNYSLKKYFFLFFLLSAVVLPLSTEAYNSPGRDGAGLQCLWGPGCIVGTNPATADISGFRQSAYDECISRNRPADFCTSAADSAQSAASTYNNCVLGGGSASTCETAANTVVNVSQPLPPLPTPTQTQSDPIRFNCDSGQIPTFNSDNNQTGCARLPGPPTGCVTTTEPPTVVTPLSNGQCPSGSTSVINGSQVSSNITYVPLEPIPGFTPSANLNFGDLLESIFKVLIILGGMIAVGAFVYAGIKYMTSDVIGSKSDAVKRLNASLLGLLLLVSSWLILYTINPQLIRFSGVLSPSAPYAPTQQSPQQTSTCIGQSCLSPAQQAAVNNAQQPGGTASPTDINTALEVQRQQQAACVAAGGSVISPGGMGLSGCRGLGFTTCSVIAGPTSGVTPPYRCGMR